MWAGVRNLDENCLLTWVNLLVTPVAQFHLYARMVMFYVVCRLRILYESGIYMSRSKEVFFFFFGGGMMKNKSNSDTGLKKQSAMYI